MITNKTANRTSKLHVGNASLHFKAQAKSLHIKRNASLVSHSTSTKNGSAHLHLTKALLQNASLNLSPYKIGLQSKNPYADFSNFEASIDKMQPLKMEHNSTMMEKALTQRKKLMIGQSIKQPLRPVYPKQTIRRMVPRKNIAP